MAAALESRWGEKLLKEILATAVRTDMLGEKDLQCVVVDTTVQEKAIAFPTDSRLYHKACGALKRRFKRRNAIELVIGRDKHAHGLGATI